MMHSTKNVDGATPFLMASAAIDVPTTCASDLDPVGDPDGDVDGLDLRAYILDNADISLADFAVEFGRICQ